MKFLAVAYNNDYQIINKNSYTIKLSKNSQLSYKNSISIHFREALSSTASTCDDDTDLVGEIIKFIYEKI